MGVRQEMVMERNLRSARLPDLQFAIQDHLLFGSVLSVLQRGLRGCGLRQPAHRRLALDRTLRQRMRGANDMQNVAFKSVRGFVGPPRKFQVHGWAFDADSPDAHLSVEIVLDGEALGTATAALFYEHLE